MSNLRIAGHEQEAEVAVEYQDAVEALVEEYRYELEQEWLGDVLRMYREKIDPAVNTLIETYGRYGELESVFTEDCDEPVERRKAISAESLPPVSKSE